MLFISLLSINAHPGIAEVSSKMDGLKEYVIGWLDWGADYVREDPGDFLSKCELSLFWCPPEVSFCMWDI